MTALPQISCIIPVYNGQDSLERAVQSVLGQRGVEAEVLLIDDFSPNPEARECAKTLAGEDPRVRTFFLPDNGGQSRARNLGGVLARAPFVTFLDQDDQHVQGWYRQALALFDQHQELGAVSGLAQIVDIPSRLSITEDDLRITGLSHVFMTNIICRRSVFLASGGFPMSEQWRTAAAGEDGQYRATLAQHWKAASCTLPALIHHAREGGATVYYLDRSRVENGRVVIEPSAWESSGAYATAAEQHTQLIASMIDEISRCLKSDPKTI